MRRPISSRQLIARERPDVSAERPESPRETKRNEAKKEKRGSEIRGSGVASRRLHRGYQGLVAARCIFVEKGLTTLCRVAVSGVGAQTLLFSARACTLLSGIFFPLFLFDDYRIAATKGSGYSAIVSRVGSFLTVSIAAAPLSREMIDLGRKERYDFAGTSGDRFSAESVSLDRKARSSGGSAIKFPKVPRRSFIFLSGFEGAKRPEVETAPRRSRLWSEPGCSVDISKYLLSAAGLSLRTSPSRLTLAASVFSRRISFSPSRPITAYSSREISFSSVSPFPFRSIPRRFRERAFGVVLVPGFLGFRAVRAVAFARAAILSRLERRSFAFGSR